MEESTKEDLKEWRRDLMVTAPIIIGLVIWMLFANDPNRHIEAIVFWIIMTVTAYALAGILKLWEVHSEKPDHNSS